MFPQLLACLILPWLLIILRRAYRSDLRTIPGPILAKFSRLYRMSLVTGGQGPHEYRKLHRQYGHAVRVGPNHVSLSDPAVIPVIYGIASKYMKAELYGTMTPEYKNKPMENIFSTRDPAEHKALKAPVAQFFALSSMKNYEPYVDECTVLFQKAMHDLQGQSIDLAIWLQWYAFDVIAGITFQRRFGFLEERRDVNSMIEGNDSGLELIKYLGNYPEVDGPVKLFLKHVLPLFGKFSPLLKFVEMCEEEIERYDKSEKGTHERTDYLSQLRQKGDKLDSKDSHRVMISHLSSNLLAGSDTTAISLRACFYYLIKNPRTLKRLREEIEQCENEGTISDPVTLEESLKMPYLQAVMKEATRLHPGVGFPLERLVPPGGASICGMDLAAGTNVSVVAPVVQMDKSVFGDDVEEFRPERWLECEKEQLHIMQRTMLVFGAGGRSCTGKNISIMEMGKFIPQIFRSFDIEWVSEKAEWDTNSAFFWKQYNMHCKFTPR